MHTRRRVCVCIFFLLVTRSKYPHRVFFCDFINRNADNYARVLNLNCVVVSLPAAKSNVLSGGSAGLRAGLVSCHRRRARRHVRVKVVNGGDNNNNNNAAGHTCRVHEWQQQRQRQRRRSLVIAPSVAVLRAPCPNVKPPPSKHPPHHFATDTTTTNQPTNQQHHSKPLQSILPQQTEGSKARQLARS